MVFPTSRFLSLAIYLIGVLWRCYHIFYAHQPTEYLFSDMRDYHRMALHSFDPQYVPTIYDTIKPPGTGWYFGILHLVDPSWRVAFGAQWLVSSLAPVVIALIAHELYGRRAAAIALILASLNFLFIDFSAYFLSENPFLLCVVTGTWLVIKGARAASGRGAIVAASLAGVVWGCAAALRSVGLVSALTLGGGLLLVAIIHRSRRLMVMVLSGGVVLLLMLIPLSIRCTRLSGGQFCVVANDVGRNVLLGHAGPIRSASWADPARHREFAMKGVPCGTEHGHRQEVKLDFPIHDTKSNLAYAWQWMRAHPAEAAMLSVHHVFDLFVGDILWPTNRTPFKRWGEWFQYLYLVCVLLPACVVLWHHGRAIITFDAARLGELLILLPIAGLLVTAFVACGELRYRIPYDGLIIVLAAGGYAQERNRQFS